MKWNVDAVSDLLASNGVGPLESKEIDHGMQLIAPNGTRVNVYSSGKILVQGKNSTEKETIQRVVNEASPNAHPSTPPQKAHEPQLVPDGAGQIDKRVFIVYGHDTKARDELELLLRRLGLSPVILGNLAPDGKTIIEALLEQTQVPYAVVLLTPDDEGHRAGRTTEIQPRARQNVVLELGMLLIRLGREKVAILHKGNIELPSDISGLIYIAFENKVSETKNKLAAALQKAGFYIDIEKLSA